MPSMTLSRTMTLQLVALVGGVGLLAAAALWGMFGLQRELTSAVGEYQQLRAVYEAGLPIAAAAESLKGGRPNRARAAEQVTQAAGRLGRFIAEQHPNRASAAAARDELEEAASLLADPQRRGRATQELAAVRRALNHIAAQVAETRKGIAAAEHASESQLGQTIAFIIGVAGLILLAAVVVGVAQYRSVMRPLGRLAAGMRQIAAGRFDHRLRTERTAEFAALAEEINRMTAQLEELYAELEAKVERTSRELVRSERLASVGHLAAGMAHELNNPLGIIAGHAELSRTALEKKVDDQSVREGIESLAIITDEAFRCKTILEKLLSLSRGGGGRRAVSMRQVAEDVMAMVRGLPDSADRQIALDMPEDDALIVRANDAELKQVLLNLVMNALAATEAGRGRIAISGNRRGGSVILSVADNGRGMDAQTLGRVFEPFFTTRTGAGAPGTGLGLSISHAIVTAHGGTLRGASDGEGAGATFTVSLPEATETDHG